MNKLITGILLRLQAAKLVNEEDAEIYQFGLECLLLKTVHILSYLIIGLCMGEWLSLVVSGGVLIPLRRKTGGYHAKTRMGCYLFSCGIVFALCLCNKAAADPYRGLIGVLVTDILILLLAPVENENRDLSGEEKVIFRRQAISYFVMAELLLTLILLGGRYLFLAVWLENGLLFAGLLLALGAVHQRVCTHIV